MGHNISAIISCDNVDETAAAALGVPVFHENSVSIVGLDPHHSDYWAEKLRLPHRNFSSVILDNEVTHEIASRIGISKFAIVETHYFGGIGHQTAVVYSNRVQTHLFEDHEASPKRSKSNISKALAAIGVSKNDALDEFEAINLRKYRTFEDDFSDFYED
nr:hypothetical protein [uncultured Hyphomonas sp.]